MGEVFRARDTRLGRWVAIKRIRVRRQSSRAHQRRFRREARTLAGLNHPAIVHLYDVLTEDGCDWIVMEHVAGPSLRQRLEAGPLPVAEVLELAREIAEGLSAAHAAGIVHRDLKTENVLLQPDGRGKIVDFGIARQLESAGGSDDPEASRLTAAGGVVGTLRSMSPEQATGGETDARSDLFSLGVLLYEAACGVSPFVGATSYATLKRVREVRQQPAHEVRPEVPRELSALIDHLLEKDPVLRPRTAAEVADALAEMQPESAPWEFQETLPPDGDPAVEAAAPGVRTRAAEGAARASSPRLPGGSGTRRVLRLGGAVLAAAVLAAAVGAATWPWPLGVALGLAGLLSLPVEPDLPDLPSIVVLPFVNLSGDPRDEVFCNGLTEDLTTDLSSLRQLFVISPTSAFTYKNRPVLVQDVGRELGVRYVLEGSVRRQGERVRVNIRLSDATTGFQVWGLRDDRLAGDFFLLPSRISSEVLGALRIEIDEIELRRIRDRPVWDLPAYHAFLQGRMLMRRNTRADVAEAQRLFERAVQLEPGFAEAWALLGATHGMLYLLLWSLDESHIDRQEEFSRRALELDPRTAEAHAGLAIVEILRQRPEAGLEHAERALELDPNHDSSHAFRAVALTILGENLEALREFNRAVRLNPRSPSLSWSAIGTVNHRLGREEEAVAIWEKVRASNADLIQPRIWLLRVYEERGLEEELARLVEEILNANPELTAARAAEIFLADPADPRSVADRHARLQRAGLP